MGRKQQEEAARASQAAQVRKDRQQAKVVLKEFREHYDELDKDKDEALDCRSSALANHFTKAAENLNKARTVDQAYVDAQIFHKLGDYSRRQAAQLQTGLKNYDVKSFVDSLVMVMQKTNSSLAADDSTPDEDAPMAMSFEEIGGSVKNLYKTVPAIGFMYGNAPTDVQRPVLQRKKAQRIKKGLVATKPSELVRGEIEQTETDKQVARMKGELKKRRKLNFWEFVVDPDKRIGYTRTIENIFHSSFLIKDMYAKLDLRSQPPMFEYTDPHAVAAAANGANGGIPENAQVILGFDIKTWKNVIHKYQISECLLPPMKRTPSKSVVRDENLERLRAMEARMDESE